MTPSQERKLDQLIADHSIQKQDLSEIKILLVGNKELEQKGLVHDIKDLKDYKVKDEKLKAKIAGGVFVGTPFFSALWAWIWSKFTGGH